MLERKCPSFSVLCLSLLPALQQAFLFICRSSFTERPLEISLRYRLETSPSNLAWGSLPVQHTFSYGTLTSGNFTNSLVPARALSWATQTWVLLVVFSFLPILSSYVTLVESVNLSEAPVPFL